MATPPPRPKLEVVDGGGDAAATPGRDAERPLLPVVIGFLLLAALLGLALQTQRVTDLEARVRGLQVDLTVANGALEAHRSHLDAVRGSVADLRAQVGALDELVARDPVAPDAPAEPPLEP